jgi:hypothetical protein
MWTRANIFDPVEETLDQRVFQTIEPRASLIGFIEKLYFRVFEKEFAGLDPREYIDLYLTGSLTTYQYSDTSDCDVSVFPHYEKFPGDPKEIRKRLIAMSIDKIDGTFLPGGLHPLQFFVVPDGTKPEDLYKTGLRSAWSFQTKAWVVQPEPDRVHNISVELPELYKRASDMADKMKQMLDHDPETARDLWRQIHTKRQLDQRAGLGDFSEGNIVYKYLLHEGLFDRIRAELGEYIAKLSNEGGGLPFCLMDGQLFTGDPNADDIGWQNHASLFMTMMDELEGSGWEHVDKIEDVPQVWGWFNFGDGRTGKMQIYTDFGAKYQDQNLGEQARKALEEKWGMPFEIGDVGRGIWRMKTESKIAGTTMWHVGLLDRISMKVIYDFNKDRIILGTQADAAQIPGSQIIGDYDQKLGTVTLERNTNQWMNTAYFRRLWQTSFPKRPIHAIHFHDEAGTVQVG